MPRSTEDITKQVVNRSANVYALARGKRRNAGIIIPSKHDAYPFVTLPAELSTPSPDEVAKHLDETLSDEVSEKPGVSVEKDKSKHRIVGELALAAAVIAGAALLAQNLDSTPGQVAGQPTPAGSIVSLTKTAGAANHLENGTYQVKIGDNDGTVYGAVETMAKAEGLNPKSTPVSEEIANQSNSINSLVAEGKVSSQSDGVVSGTGQNQTEFYVVPDRPVVNPTAFNAPAKANQEFITKAIS